MLMIRDAARNGEDSQTELELFSEGRQRLISSLKPLNVTVVTVLFIHSLPTIITLCTLSTFLHTYTLTEFGKV